MPNVQAISKHRHIQANDRSYREKFDRLYTLEYQPQYEICSGEMVAVEALLRNKVDNTSSAPEQEINLAERNGSIHALGQWIIQRALSDFLQIKDRFEIQRVAVNVSPVQIAEPGFVEELLLTISEIGASCEHLELEVTEKFPLNFSEHVAKNIQLLEALRIRVVLDDFGSGYTSRPLLTELPVSGIKLDKMFCNQLDNQRYLEVVKSLLQLAKALNIEVLIEGIENKQQLKIIRSLHCQYAQGYFLQRPQPREKFFK